MVIAVSGNTNEENGDNLTRVAINDANVIFWTKNIFAFEKAVIYHRNRLALTPIEC